MAALTKQSAIVTLVDGHQSTYVPEFNLTLKPNLKLQQVKFKCLVTTVVPSLCYQVLLSDDDSMNLVIITFLSALTTVLSAHLTKGRSFSLPCVTIKNSYPALAKFS